MKALLVFGFYLTLCDGANILGVFNHPGGSHTFLGKVLLKNLAQKGHHVVMISSFPMKEPVENYEDISLPENLEDLIRRNKKFDKNMRNELDELKNMTLQHTENTFTNPQVKKLLKSNATFDVIIMDWFFNEASLIFGHIYKAPVIYSSSFGNNALVNEITGNTLPISYVPGAALAMTDDMPFKYRALMTLFHLVHKLLIPRRNKAHYELLQKYFENPPTIEELQENVALVLSNSHFSFETPRPYTPNIIPIGGFHVQEPKELPKDLKIFLDSAKEGVIYFSLGSQIKSSNLKKETFSNILKALGRLPYKILWKYEADDLSDVPENIKISKWLPQLDVLAHPNVKLFITHGGSLSFIETIHFGVPVICIPFNGDQFTNAAFMESRGIGLYTLLDNITEDGFFNMIREVITDPKYAERMKFHSDLLREQPIKPLDLAIYWVEHVIKHKGANHLKTFALKLPWYKYYLVDVIGLFLAVIIIVLTIILFVSKKIFCMVCRLFRRKKSKTA